MNQPVRLTLRGMVVGFAVTLLVVGVGAFLQERKNINVKTQRYAWCGDATVLVSLQKPAPNGAFPDSFVICGPQNSYRGDQVTWMPATGEPIAGFVIQFHQLDNPNMTEAPFSNPIQGLPDQGKFVWQSSPGGPNYVSTGPAKGPCILPGCSKYFKYNITVTDSSGKAHSFDPGGHIWK